MIRHGINSGRIIRKASCRRRLARFLRTARLSNLREQMTPHLGTGSGSEGSGRAYSMTVKKLTCFRPCSRTAANSDFRVSLPLFFEDCFNAGLSVNLITGRGLSLPAELRSKEKSCSRIRPERVFFCPWHDGFSGPCGPRGLPFWRGIRTYVLF